MACRLSMSITSFLADRVREQWSLGVLHLQVARISGNEVVRFFGTRRRDLESGYGSGAEIRKSLNRDGLRPSHRSKKEETACPAGNGYRLTGRIPQSEHNSKAVARSDRARADDEGGRWQRVSADRLLTAIRGERN